MKNLNLRRAQAEDALSIAYLGVRTYLETYQKIAQEDWAHMRAYMLEAFYPVHLIKDIQDTKNTYLLVEVADEVIAYAKIVKGASTPGIEASSSINIEKIYVRKDFTGRKIGRMLMEHILRMAQAQGFKRVWLGVWDINQKAIAFYQKFGFELIGIHPFDMGGKIYEDLLMKKELGSDEK